MVDHDVEGIASDSVAEEELLDSPLGGLVGVVDLELGLSAEGDHALIDAEVLIGVEVLLELGVEVVHMVPQPVHVVVGVLLFGILWPDAQVFLDVLETLVADDGGHLLLHEVDVFVVLLLHLLHVSDVADEPVLLLPPVHVLLGLPEVVPDVAQSHHSEEHLH
jgi:hypothetical protein